MARATGSDPEIDREAARVSAAVDDRMGALTSVVRALDDEGISADDIALRRPTLDEVFLRLTGHHPGQDQDGGDGSGGGKGTPGSDSNKEVAA